MEADTRSIQRWLKNASEWLRPYSLTGDLRLTIFARVFALGTISSVLEFMLEQARIGPLTEYMERWSRLIPSTGWSSRTGLTLQFASAAISILIFILPCSRELLCLLAGTFLLAQLASPERIASHCSMMAGALLVILILAIAEWIDLAARGRKRAAPSKAWYEWTLIGLRCICTLTYFFAFFYKLNPNWFSPAGKAPSFLIRPLKPLLDLLGMTAGFSGVLAPISIYGTLVVEFSLPMLLFLRRTRLLGCFIGIVFSLGMVGQGVADFPILIVAFYAAFLSRAEARALVERFCVRPTTGKIIATALLASVWFIQGAKANWMYAHQYDPQIMAVYSSVGFVNFVFLIYVAITLAQWLWQGGLSPVEEVEAEVVGGGSQVDNLRPRSTWTVAVSAAVVLLVNAGFVYDNLAGFFALPSAGAMIMFSGISPDLSNHFVLPRTSIGGWFDYVSVTRFSSSDRNSPPAREFGSLVEWLRLRPRPYQLNMNDVRYHMSRICKASNKPTVELSLVTRVGEMLDFDDVCAAPDMLWYVPLPIASACVPRCNGELAKRARREGSLSRVEDETKPGPEL